MKIVKKKPKLERWHSKNFKIGDIVRLKNDPKLNPDVYNKHKDDTAIILGQSLSGSFIVKWKKSGKSQKHYVDFVFLEKIK